MAKGRQLWESGDRKKAVEYFQQCVDVTPEMAAILIRELKKHGIKFVVAPYEADSQLTYLEKEGLVDGVITEDSDLIVYGCKKLLYKMQPTGSLIEIDTSELGAAKDVDLRGWSFSKFRSMCILSGCDYLPSLSGIGLKTGYKLLKKCHNIDRTLRTLTLNRGADMPGDYVKLFQQAELTFSYQRVFDPRTSKLVFLNEPDENSTFGYDLETCEFLGPKLDDEVATGIALGLIDPISKEKFNLPPPIQSKKAAASKPASSIFAVSQSVKPLQSKQPSPPKQLKRKQVDDEKKPSIFSRFFQKKPSPQADVNPQPILITNQPSLESNVFMMKKAKHEQFCDVLDETNDENCIKQLESPPKNRRPQTSFKMFSDLIEKFQFTVKASSSEPQTEEHGVETSDLKPKLILNRYQRPGTKKKSEKSVG